MPELPEKVERALMEKMHDHPRHMTAEELSKLLHCTGDEYWWKVVAEEAIRRLREERAP